MQCTTDWGFAFGSLPFRPFSHWNSPAGTLKTKQFWSKLNNVSQKSYFLTKYTSLLCKKSLLSVHWPKGLICWMDGIWKCCHRNHSISHCCRHFLEREKVSLDSLSLFPFARRKHCSAPSKSFHISRSWRCSGVVGDGIRTKPLSLLVV